MSRHLTKSRFKLGAQCPTKLFYTRKRDVYPDKSCEDSFLASLADGGHQVGELATLYYPGGERIHTLNEADALAQTNELLAQEDATIYEAAILHGNLFIRIDVLRKRGNMVELIEVKAKSCDGGGAAQFAGKRGIYKKWLPYLQDVTFQKFVLQQAFPAFEVSAFLMLVDKQVPCPTDGLHQKFLLVQDRDGRTGVEVTAPLSEGELLHPILRTILVDEIAESILEATNHGPAANMSFGEWVTLLSDHYEDDRRIPSPIGGLCKTCTFRATPEEQAGGMRSGFEECWSAAPEWSEPNFERPTVLDIGNNCRKADKLIKDGRASMLEVTAEDLGYETGANPKMSQRERQWLQVAAAQKGDTSMVMRRESLARELESWTYPLHFIDFETASPAIPIHRNLHPYEPLAFQYSHHIVHEDGRVEHHGEYIDAGPGTFPNFDFVRALMAELEGDEGTIFRYAAHENVILGKIRQQLRNAGQGPDDGLDLIRFIESITQAPGTKGTAGTPAWPTPERNMVDMLELVRSYYYDPAMNGSNSIKKVLPAVLNASDFLKHKYAAPVYGTPDLPSLNFKDKVWVQLDGDGAVRDPYELLPPLFTDVAPEEVAHLMSADDELRDGGAAMTAYVRMQFAEMTDAERQALRGALLKYCELDTLAMVMIFEAWREWLA
ncbi:MAG: hypothetical protein ACI8QZ_003360 [Chlamydiales bacterium]|jgi:hypothetical protein